MKYFLFINLISFLIGSNVNAHTKQVDVSVYGGTSAGIIAAYSAIKMGKTVLLIEPGKHLGD